MTAHIRLEGLTIAYEKPHESGTFVAVAGLDLDVPRGTFVTIVGPSGCGKSSVLLAIAGLTAPTAGRVLVNGAVVAAPGRDRAMVFQEFALMPWRTVVENVRFGLELQRWSGDGEWRLVADVMRDARMLGAEDIRVMIARPREASSFRPVESVPFHDDDVVSVLLATSWEHYWGESIRTFRIAGNRFMPLWPSGLDARFRALVTEIKPGVTTGGWTRAALAAMTAAERGAIAPYGLGGGIGITPGEWPPLTVEDETTIDAGMCFAVRVACESPDGLLLLHGDTIVV